MDFETVKVENIEEGILKISVNRPDKMNCLNLQVVKELADAMEMKGKDPDVRVIILAGEGGKAFISGADMDEHRRMSPLQVREEYHGNFLRFLNLMDTCEKPIIGAVKGYAFGGGNIVAMHCDLTFATTNSHFGQQEIAVGLIGGVSKLAHLVGVRKAMDIVFSGRVLKAQEAESIGLINKCLIPEDFDSYVLDYARKLASRPAMLLKGIKIARNIYERTNLQVAMQYEYEIINQLYSSQASHEAMTAFVEKRDPVYTDKKYWP